VEGGGDFQRSPHHPRREKKGKTPPFFILLLGAVNFEV
jgi:hypothetical protein